MSLSESQRVRYARHLLLPELGEEGQLRLLAGRVRFADGVARGVREVAEEYLRRAGVSVVGAAYEGADDDENVSVDVSVRVVDHDHDHDHHREERNEGLLVLSPPSLLVDPSLSHAAEALSGAFAAVEAMKRLARIGEPAELDRNLLRAEEV